MNLSVRPLHLTVSAICEKSGRFLMVEEKSQHTHSTVINQPSGHVEPNESLLAAVIRETQEETGHYFTPQGIIGIYQLTTDTHKTYFRICFYGSASVLEPQPALDPDILATHWMTEADILSHPSLRSPLVSACLNDYLAGKRFGLDILQTLN